MFMRDSYDAIVIGGSFAGISAATYIARGRRSVCVIDAGAPRNRFARHSHGLFGQDGLEPAAMLANARAQLALYREVSFVAGEAIDARRHGDAFHVTLADGRALTASRLVLAYGIRDELPAIPGLAERWGRSVVHCPYCHGYEFGGQRIGVLAITPASLHQALLVSDWGPTVFYLNGVFEPDAHAAAELRARGIEVEATPVRALHGEGDALSAVELADGRLRETDVLYIGPRARQGSDIAERLGCAFEDVPFGRIVRTDAMKATTVPGVFATGDMARGAHSVTWACADGVMAGAALHRSLVFPEVLAA